MSGETFPDRAALEFHQRTALRELTRALLPSNRFYAAKLSAAQLTGEAFSLEDFFARMPFTAKAELVADQSAHPPYGTNLTFPIERYTRFHQTSGTSGVPLRWLDTPESWAWMSETWAQVFRMAGVSSGDRIFFAFSFGPFLGFWTAFEAGLRLGCLCLPGGGMSSAARLRAILDNAATVLCCTPTYAIRLGEVAEEEGIDLSRSQVRAILLAGEPGGSLPAVRERIQSIWPGARPFDHHGMTEVGPVTFECPMRPGVLHVLENAFIPEVIHPQTGVQVGPGETGELVLTNLGRIGSPLLRYRTGDLVQRAAALPCACGRFDLALEGGILGRTDDMVVVRGVNLYPSALEDVIHRFPMVAEYRAELYTERAMQEIRLQVEPAPECPDPAHLLHELEVALRAAFNLRIPVHLAEPGSLPRFELKARRWIRL
jgi:phenylacetate-CoA ligase